MPTSTIHDTLSCIPGPQVQQHQTHVPAPVATGALMKGPKYSASNGSARGGECMCFARDRGARGGAPAVTPLAPVFPAANARGQRICQKYDLPGRHRGSHCQEAFNNSNQAVPLVSNVFPSQRSEFPENEMYDDYKENKSVRSEDFDGRSRFTSNRDESVSTLGQSRMPPLGTCSRMLARGLMEKEALAVWREKLAPNLLIWFICACAVFVIAVLGVVTCPTEHVFSMSELASHPSILSPNNVYTSVRGEVFNLTTVAATHQCVVHVVPTKAILKYGGQSADNIFPVQAPFPFVFLILVLTLVYVLSARTLPRKFGRSAAIYNGLVYDVDVTNYLTSPPLFDHTLVHAHDDLGGADQKDVGWATVVGSQCVCVCCGRGRG
ncbi:hypothetical protein K443DRAFT_124493 [Laccaria amethystina LaAM-08-1]|uniref:Uncharacterized protein n=1 Tax=Laccaria amethystina LaAM-08-1 TaxID=1095629 RepID=A0A0C9WKG3_9AGAR|nr:hypothetical protein K443DRAFT_124493 [Laccaria amethystina LaAM-08-1]